MGPPMENLIPSALTSSCDLQASLRADPRGFAFRSELSLAPLVAYWMRDSPGDRPAKTALGRIISEEIQRAPELLQPIKDAAVLERHQALVDVLMAAVFPPASWEQEFGAALMPFHLRGFYATPPMRRLLMSPDGSLQGRVNLDPDMVSALRMALAYGLILKRVYGVEINVDYPLIFTITDPETGLDRHFRKLFDWQFVDVVVEGEVPPLTPAVQRRLHANFLEPDLLREALPPDRFVLRGVTIYRAMEVTDQEVLSALERDLIDRESIVSGPRFLKLQARLRTFFRRPELRFGLAALDRDRVMVLNYGSRHEHACIFADSRHHKVSDFAGTIYDRAVRSGEPLIIDDLAALPGRTAVEEEILGSGVRNMIVAPLHYQDRVIGTMELDSPHPGDLDATHLPKLRDLLPLFAMAVQRSMEELNARIQTQIKEKFTAIHPVVEWRFRQAVLDSLERFGEATGGVVGELDPIVFENVYPLYALSDIRGSSTERALAIQADLLVQLRLARDVVQAAHRARPLPALDELLYRIDQHAARTEDSLSSGGELEVVTFLRRDVEALFEHLQSFGAEARAPIEAYRAALDPRHGVVYRRRQVFEESVTRIADTISSYLDLEELAAQAMFPHYFEKQKTDGVDHQLYVGGSLLEDGRFDPLYLKSLRLWQLMVLCGIAARADRLTERLPIPLRTTHLVLVQHAPLSIRFRFDEKRFDVDGAYDIRYEIVKKRIDKARVKGRDERVTQPGTIAIVYAQPDEAAEYRSYVEYLQHLGYLGAAGQELELEELQGVHGLRALRVPVTLQVGDGETPRAADVVSSADRVLR
jgi:hypothetical protein